MAETNSINAYAPPAQHGPDANNGPFARAWRRFTQSLVPILLIAAVSSGLKTTWNELMHEEPPPAETEAYRKLGEDIGRASATHASKQDVEKLGARQAELLKQSGGRMLATIGHQAKIGFVATLLGNVASLLMVLVIFAREKRTRPGLVSFGFGVRLALALMLLWAAEFVGAVACLVPGIAIAIADSFVPILVLMEGLGPWAALKRSFVLTWRGGAAVMVPGVLLSVVGLAVGFAALRLRAEHYLLAVALHALFSFLLGPAALLWLSFWEDAREAEASIEAVPAGTT